MDGVDGHARLTEPLGDPTGKDQVILDYQHPHPSKYASLHVTSVRQHG